MILRQHYMYALYPHNNQSVSVHTASYMFIASTEVDSSVYIVFTIGSVERCTVDIETAPFNASQTIEQ